MEITMEAVVSKLTSLQKTLLVFLHDTLISLFAILLSVVIRHGEWPSSIFYHSNHFLSLFFLLISAQLFCFYLSGFYKGIWRYSSTHDLVMLIKGVTVAVVSSLVVAFLYNRLEGIPRSMFFIDWLLLVIGLGGGRFSYRLLRDRLSDKQLKSSGKNDSIIIVGAGAAGEQLFREIKKTPTLGMRVVAFVDDDLHKRGRVLHGIKIMGGVADIPQIINKTGASKIYIAIPSASSEQIRSIVKVCRNTPLEFKTLPHVSDILEGKMSFSQLREVQLEDLLGRKAITLDSKSIDSMVQGSVVMVSGAGGSIGSELCVQIAKFKPKMLIMFEMTEYFLYKLEQEIQEAFPDLEYRTVIGDVRDELKVERVLEEFVPSVIFHAAAYKHVPMMEANPLESIHTNVFGTRVLAEAAVKFEVKRFVMISTDKAVNPTNIMGATKRVAEMVCQHVQKSTSKTKFMTVRFGNVLGSSGSVVPLFKKQIASGGPITITHPEIKRYFMTIPEASQLVLQAGAIGNGSEIFVLDMGKPVKIYDLAKQLISLAGLTKEDIEIKYTGLRPGEKLFEELLLDGEHALPTIHPLVKVARVKDVSENFIGDMTALSELILSRPSRALVFEVLKRLVPEFSFVASTNSNELLSDINKDQVSLQ